MEAQYGERKDNLSYKTADFGIKKKMDSVREKSGWKDVSLKGLN